MENSNDNGGNLVSIRPTSGLLKTFEPATTKLPENQENLDRNKQTTVSPVKDPTPRKTSDIDTTTNRRSSIREPEVDVSKTRQDGMDKPIEDVQLLSEEEMNQIADQYASVELEMDEDLLDKDDLLDDVMEEDTVIPETQEVGNQATKDQNIEGGALGGDEKEKDKSNRTSPETRQEMEQSKKPQKDKLLPTNSTKRRGTRSPDTKGLAASKKLASRGRASPRGKQRRQGRLSSSRVSNSTVVPRFEVYPPATKGRKVATVSGSVGSQKQPSTHI